MLDALCTHPILWYPDPDRPYVLFTDASKYGWAGVLTQPYEEIDELTQSNADPDATPKKTVIHHPVAYISGLFRGNQLNLAALTKEAYAIYLSVQKLSFYLTDADVLIRSNHLPLKKFLKQNTMNTKVNNWVVELETYNLRFEYIQGIKNTLADTLSRLLKIDPDVALPDEPSGYEFGYNFFEELPPVEVGEIIVEGIKIKLDPDIFFKDLDLTLPLKSRSIRSLQAQDAKIHKILHRLQVGDLPPNVYLIEDSILRRRIVETTGNQFRPIVLPRSMVDHILMIAHDHGGHNGFPRMYVAIRQLYYWVGMKRDIQQHCKRCQLCAKHNIAKVKFKKTHFKGARQLMQFFPWI